MVIAGQSGTPIDVSYTSHLPETYPDWIPVDTRLTPLGNEVRTMAHLHGGFVAADSDGNPAVTPDGFGHGQTQHVHYTNAAPRNAGLAALVPRSRLRHHAAGRVRRPRRRLPPARRARHRHRAQPDRRSRRSLRHPARDPGPPVQARREVPVPGQRHPGHRLDRRVLRRSHAGQRQGVAVPARRAADVPIPDPERMQCADHEPAPRRPATVADRRRGRALRPARALAAAGPGVGGARGRPGRLPRAGWPDPVSEEQHARGTGVHPGPAPAGP